MPAAVVVALILGAGTRGRVILFVVAPIALVMGNVMKEVPR